MSRFTAFEAMLDHPAPGLHFPEHPYAKIAERVLPAPHRVGSPADWAALDIVTRLTNGANEVQQQLVEFYSRWNGADLCCLPDPEDGSDYCPAMVIFPIEDWECATQELTEGDLSWMFEDLQEMYTPGNYISIGGHPSEETRFVLFTKGEFEGQALAGKVFCVAMDPVLDYTEVLAESFEAFISAFATDPVAFLLKVGYGHFVIDEQGRMCGAPPDRYLPDARDAY